MPRGYFPTVLLGLERAEVFYDHAFYNVHYYHLAIVAAGLALFGLYYIILGRWLRADSLIAGVLLLVAGLQLLLVAKAPTSGFLLGFPLVFGTLNWLWSLCHTARPLQSVETTPPPQPLALPLVSLGLTLPAIALLAPALFAMLTMVGLGPLVLAAILLLVLLLGLLLPVLLPLLSSWTHNNALGSWQLPMLATFVALAALVAGVKLYWATYRDCQQCPLKPTCVPRAKRKQLTKTIYDAACRRAWQRQQSRRGHRHRRLRQSTVEPVFGHLLHHYGLRRMNVRGQAGAHKTMLLTAVAYNLKKLLKHRPNQQVSLAMALPPPLLAANRRARQHKNPPCATSGHTPSRYPETVAPKPTSATATLLC